MAELLVKAKAHWMDSLPQDAVDKMTKEEKQSYDARSQIGDIIVVKPDGWEWGREECPPNFVVVKLPGVKEEDAKFYEQPLMDKTDAEKPVLLKTRQYAVDVATVTACKVEVGGAKEVAKVSFDAQLVDKSK